MSSKIKIFKLTPTAKLPTKAKGDMCYDAYSDEDAVVEFGVITTIKTGIKISPPEGYHFSIRPRSGLAVKEGIHVMAGQVDNGYRGEVLVCLTTLKMNNIKDDPMSYITLHRYNIKKGDKIAQIKFEKDATFDVIEVNNEEELGYTTRGEGGFGSTGK